MKKFITILLIAVVAVTAVFATFDPAKLSFAAGGTYGFEKTYGSPKADSTTRVKGYHVEFGPTVTLQYRADSFTVKAEYSFLMPGTDYLRAREFGNWFSSEIDKGHVEALGHNFYVALVGDVSVKDTKMSVEYSAGPTYAFYKLEGDFIHKVGLAADAALVIPMPSVKDKVGAELMLGAKGTAYIYCPECVIDADAFVNLNTALNGFIAIRIPKL